MVVTHELTENLPQLCWTNRFASLGSAFYTQPVLPTPLQPAPSAHWVGRNRALAKELGLDAAWLEAEDALQIFTGNEIAAGSTPLASVYSGHQFGQWAGQLGDGRAILLGDIQTPAGIQEIQLKGAGRTPYSRGGDGRAVLRSSIREFLASEAMHGLGIATTRALCVTGSRAPVRRETLETAAVVTRISPTFIRFGHFEHFSTQGDTESLKKLADFVIEHFYPECQGAEGNPYAALLQAVSEKTALLMADWQAVGFCHGVMNTDNMGILGQTLDYGPFQFLDAFDPNHVCNHSDTQGRYAYNRQPNMAYWNLFALGQALLPLMDSQEQALAALESYKTIFPDALQSRMRAKLGLVGAEEPGDKALVDATFRLLAQNTVDYPIFWRRLGSFTPDSGHEAVRDLFFDRESFNAWALSYSERLTHVNRALRADLMRKTNPKYVLRNHLGELAIRAAREGDFSQVDALLEVLQAPFDEHPAHEAALAGFPPDWAKSIEISCSS